MAALGSAVGFLGARIQPRVIRLNDARLAPLYGGRSLPDVVLELIGRPSRVYLLGSGDAMAASFRATGIEVIQQDPKPPTGVHQAIHYLDLARDEPLPSLTSPREIPPFLDVTDADRDAARRWLGRSGGHPILLLPGSGGLKKCWSGFPELARAFFGRPVFVVLGPDEMERGWSAANFPGATVLEGPDLSALAGMFERSALVIGNDSGTSHLAAAVGGRVLALFGPTDPVRWRPVGAQVRVVQRRPLSALSVEAVLRLALEILETAP